MFAATPLASEKRLPPVMYGRLRLPASRTWDDGPVIGTRLVFQPCPRPAGFGEGQHFRFEHEGWCFWLRVDRVLRRPKRSLVMLIAVSKRYDERASISHIATEFEPYTRSLVSLPPGIDEDELPRYAAAWLAEVDHSAEHSPVSTHPREQYERNAR